MSDNNKSTVLIAEDNEDVRELLRVYLEIHKYDVIEAANGEEAVEAARASRPDLIMMDLDMPEMDGIQAIEEIRQESALENIPILVNSAHGNLGIEFFLNVGKFGKGYIEYLVKPLNYTELAYNIRKLIAKSRAGSNGAA